MVMRCTKDQATASKMKPKFKKRVSIQSPAASPKAKADAKPATSTTVAEMASELDEIDAVVADADPAAE